jgi:hypothetical protein
MRTYLVAITCIKERTVYARAIKVVAADAPHAQRLGMEVAHQRWPRSGKYTAHAAAVFADRVTEV